MSGGTPRRFRLVVVGQEISCHHVIDESSAGDWHMIVVLGQCGIDIAREVAYGAIAVALPCLGQYPIRHEVEQHRGRTPQRRIEARDADRR